MSTIAMITDGAWYRDLYTNPVKTISQCSFAVYKSDTEKLHWDEIVDRQPYYAEVRNDLGIIFGNEYGSPAISEICGLWTGVSWLCHNSMLNKNTSLIIYSDSMTCVHQLLGYSKCRVRTTLEMFRGVIKLFEKAKEDTGFNYEKQLSVVWVPGTEVKKSYLKH